MEVRLDITGGELDQQELEELRMTLAHALSSTGEFHVRAVRAPSPIGAKGGFDVMGSLLVALPNSAAFIPFFKTINFAALRLGLPFMVKLTHDNHVVTFDPRETKGAEAAALTEQLLGPQE